MLTKIHLSAPVLLKTLPIKGFKHLSVSVAPTTRPQLKMAASALPDPFPSLVSAEWLHAHLSCVKVLDAHWYLPVPANRGKHALEDFCQNRIPTAQFFDLDGIVDHSTNLPHMLPSPEAFAAAADAFGVGNDDAVIIYDRTGVWSAPRAWFTWHVMGHKRVAVLDGGLSAWVDAGYPLDASPMDANAANAASRAVKSPPPKEQLRYRANLDGNQVRSWEQVLENIGSQKEVVVDARPAERWRGEAPEPRPGLSQGGIPGSYNVPFASLLQNGKMKPPEQIAEVFADAGVDVSAPLVVSCGSGTTAAVLALAIKQLPGVKGNAAIYDGSWAEWGGREDLPIGVAAPAPATGQLVSTKRE